MGKAVLEITTDAGAVVFRCVVIDKGEEGCSFDCSMLPDEFAHAVKNKLLEIAAELSAMDLEEFELGELPPEGDTSK